MRVTRGDAASCAKVLCCRCDAFPATFNRPHRRHQPTMSIAGRPALQLSHVRTRHGQSHSLTPPPTSAAIPMPVPTTVIIKTYCTVHVIHVGPKQMLVSDIMPCRPYLNSHLPVEDNQTWTGEAVKQLRLGVRKPALSWYCSNSRLLLTLRAGLGSECIPPRIPVMNKRHIRKQTVKEG